VLILPGDHLYRMDYAAMAQLHFDKDADITIAVQPTARQNAGRFGILKRDADGRITDFAEKPTDPVVLENLVSRADPERPYLASMGIYLFKTEVLIDMLENNTYDDFGSQVIPAGIDSHKIYGFDFDGYWEDVGTIRSFYETNLMLTMPKPPFNLFDPKAPIYTNPRWLPGSTIENSELKDVLLAEGCCIHTANIRHSVIGLRSQIRHGTRIEDSILMGSDYYDKPCCEDDEIPGKIPLGIGSGCNIQGAIIDKNAHIGRGVTIHSFPRDTKKDGENYVVRDGIVIIPKDAVIQPGTYIGPPQIPPE
jgi:glucose-1-phosphate adenylyltransferase